MKGIILSGGAGTRLYPASKIINKGLLPVYDKPMIYYPLSTLMLSGITEILVIASDRDVERFQELLGDGNHIGLNISYEIEYEIKGIGNAFIMAKTFIGKDSVCLVLGDNIFYGHKLPIMLRDSVRSVEENNTSVIFGYYVQDPKRYGVVEFNKSGKVVSIEEKPTKPKSSYAVTGLYFYPNDVVKKVNNVLPSDRGELEITTINQMYLNEDRLSVQLMGRGYAWLDTGTHVSLLEASIFIETIERRQGLKIACIEEIAYIKGFITKEQFQDLAKMYSDNKYGQYLFKRAEEIA